MKLIDLNRHGGIGANSIYIELGPFKLVIDAGMHPKVVGKMSTPDLDKIPARHLDAIILTHCHLDHLGAIPVLSRKFPSTQIICSVPTALLAPRMMHNSVSVMSMQREELGIKEYPLFTRADIASVEKMFLPTPFRKIRYLTSGKEELAVTLYSSGHIPGAASVLLTYKHRKIFITGDVLFEEQWTIPGADLPKDKVDVLITETTRGATTRKASRLDEAQRLLTSLNASLEVGAPVLMPVFALGRMQEMLSLFAEARQARALLPAPIFCTGLGVDLIDYYDELRRKTGLVHFNRKIIKELKVRSMPDFSPARGLKESGIYLVSSGMMTEKTPSYSVAAAMMGVPHASILFVGYCDPETPGGAIQRMKHGEQYLFTALDLQAELKANVEKFDISGHADREELVAYAHSIEPRAVVLTHGDPLARECFKKELKGPKVILDPIPLKEYEV